MVGLLFAVRRVIIMSNIQLMFLVPMTSRGLGCLDLLHRLRYHEGLTWSDELQTASPMMICGVEVEQPYDEHLHTYVMFYEPNSRCTLAVLCKC